MKSTLQKQHFTSYKEANSVSLLILAIATFITIAILTSCNSPEKKVENAQENVEDAKDDLAKANQEYMDDIENYKNQTAIQLEQNDKELAEFRLKVQNEKNEAKAEYNKKIEAMEEKNRTMKQKMADYKADGKENWNSFKTEFSHDMDEIAQAFKDLRVNNVK